MADAKLVKDFLDHRDVLMGFIFALTRDYDVAEEVFQEVSLAILGEVDKNPRIGNFMAWAREVARRRVADYYRKATRRMSAVPLSNELADVIADAFAENDAALENHQERMGSLLECLKRLTGRSRDVVEGFYHRRQSLKEVAASIGWNEASVKVALSRARKALADCVQTRLRIAVQDSR
jgi:RNA polymerase sigma-70 factor (ECF subfamily)